MSTAQSASHKSTPTRSADRWLAIGAVVLLLGLGASLWAANGTHIFTEVVAGLWALCF